MSETLGLVGVGKWGKNYLTTAEKMSGVQIKYICARNPESLAQFSDQYQKTNSVADLLQQPDLNGVIVATPPLSHFSIVKSALAQGVNVLVEKPLTLDSVQADQLTQLAKNSPAKVMVGHIMLFNPAYQAAKALLPSLGKLQEIRFAGLGVISRDDYSAIWDWGPHPVSICLDLLDSDPIHSQAKVIARAASGLISDARINLTFASGVKAEFDVNWQPSPKVRLLHLIGEKGTIIMDDTNQDGQKLTLSIAGQADSHPEYDDQSPLEVELQAFVQAISAEQPIKSDLAFGARVVKIVEEIENSAA